MILDKILETKKEEVAEARRTRPLAELKEVVKGLPICRNLQAAISGKPCSVIAEVKCASPSRGRLIENFDPLALARIYEANGAAAISVLTDEKYFMGHKKYLTQIREEVQLPLLRKDFIIDPYQIYESRAIGADALLLIVRLLGDRLGEYLVLAQELGLSALTEVHTAAELETALSAGAGIIGINNRNLDTFVTDINICKELARHIAPGKIIVAESAIKNRADIVNIMQAGIHAFLIGEALVTVPYIGEKLREFCGE